MLTLSKSAPIKTKRLFTYKRKKKRTEKKRSAKKKKNGVMCLTGKKPRHNKNLSTYAVS